MTTTTVPVQPAASAAQERPAGFAGLMLSEWTKIRSVRSTVWSLAVLVVLTLVFTGLFMKMGIANWDDTNAAQRAEMRMDPTGTILGSGILLSQLAVCVLGVMAIASEYSTGMIRASLLAVPRRVPVLAAKSAVFGLLVLVVGEVTAFGSFFVGAPILDGKAPVALGDAGVVRAVVGCGLYLALLGLFALAVGAIVRHTAAAITTVVGFVLVITPMAGMLPGSVGEHIHAWLPTEAGFMITQQHARAGDLLGPWEGLGVLALWTAALMAVAAVQLRRRDA
ncbi:ABC transporter permease [Streptomyces coelicoflavus]|uniref:ABC transporter permease n=1 Tax=Streptomyces TaxID=1883 RepID=UPI0012924DFA|nr:MULTISPECIES: ABC transporter permease [Streptomyces]KAF2774742.1 ABC transporter transmembrane protein [Streptomyces sp. OM5714]MCX5041472.1 ABC transporter permease [Streptomyces coelicoflavus]NHI12091.1 ABC transporter transmembrane protein [Streptomyces sp. KO7888]QFX87028.1 ABC transporter permease [Streptomyces sp. SYP-A7193]